MYDDASAEYTELMAQKEQIGVKLKRVQEILLLGSLIPF